MKQKINFQLICQIGGILILISSILLLPLISNFASFLFILVLVIIAVELYRWSKMADGFSFNFLITSKQAPELKVTRASILRGERIATVARNLSAQPIPYENIHYEAIEKALISKSLDCSSFVRRVIYLATKTDIGNLMSNQFATSAYFISFKQHQLALPGDIVHVRGHVAICLDRGCRTVAEASYNENGLVIHSTSKSAISHTWAAPTYYRLRPQ